MNTKDKKHAQPAATGMDVLASASVFLAGLFEENS